MTTIYRRGMQALLRLVSANFTQYDDEALRIFGTWSENRIECVALLSLWQHAFQLFRWKYSYLRCLASMDRMQFLVKAVQLLVLKNPDSQQRRNMILSGQIELELWIDIMKNIPLVSNYKLWRCATNWEVYRVTYDRNRLTPFHVEVMFFENAARSPNKSTNNVLYKYELSDWFFLMSLASRVCVCETTQRSTEHRCSICGSRPHRPVMTGYEPINVPLAEAVLVTESNNLDCSVFSISV